MQAPSNLIRTSGTVVRLGGVLGIVLAPILVYLWTTHSHAYLTCGKAYFLVYLGCLAGLVWLYARLKGRPGRTRAEGRGIGLLLAGLALSLVGHVLAYWGSVQAGGFAVEIWGLLLLLVGSLILGVAYLRTNVLSPMSAWLARTKRRNMLLLAVVMACATIVGGCGSPEPAVDSGGTLVSMEGRIAFTRATSFTAPKFESEVYAINADGSGERRLTDSPGLDAFPAWSPDGKKIAFASDRDGNWEIYVMDADGSNQTRLTNTPEEAEAMPAFSPNGKNMAYATDPAGSSPAVWVMKAGGTNRERLTAGNWPSWSPDGERISYTTYTTGVRINVINADGSNPRSLTGGSSDEEGTFSPDGEKIAFSSGRDGFLWWENAEIYVMNADGSGQKRLTHIEGSDHWPPTWSPDSTRIAFTSDGADEVGDIYAMNADGSGLTRLTDDPAEDSFPAWQP